MLMDACVLIDYIKTGSYVLELIVKHVGPVYVVSPVVEEVNDVENEEELAELGLTIIEPEVEDAFTAASTQDSLSFQDKLCLLTAKRYGFTCVTNDKSLRNRCSAAKIPLLWGLELLVTLHKSRGISGDNAIGLARKIHSNNPKHITIKILERFIKNIHAQ